MAIGYIAFLTPSEATRIIGWLDKATFGVFSGSRKLAGQQTAAPAPMPPSDAQAPAAMST